MPSSIELRKCCSFLLLLLLLLMLCRISKSFVGLGPVYKTIASRALLAHDFSAQRSFNKSPQHYRKDRNGYRGRDNAFGGLTFQNTVRIDPGKVSTVEEMNFSEITQSFLLQKGFKELTPVQSQAFQAVFDGKDIVARSRTGTGKTLAFGLPIIEKIVSENKNFQRARSPTVLILEPTRELAVQVAQELGSLLRQHRMRIAAIYGGTSFHQQVSTMKSGVHFVVGTPGRILDHISRGTIDLSSIQHVILDEGDTMLEMGFQKSVEAILASLKASDEESKKLAMKSLSSTYDSYENENDGNNETDLPNASAPSDVQMLLFSATMPSWICTLTDRLMKNPTFLDAVQEGETRLADTIKHIAIPLPMANRRSTGSGESVPNARVGTVVELLEDVILTKGNGGQCIVFSNFKEDCDHLVSSKAFSRLRAAVLHGDVSQSQRSETLLAFKQKQIDVLVATDVAARGLDIAGVDLVIHTALPNDADSYVHRSGRTGRAGRSGTAVVLFTPADQMKMRDFERKLKFSFTYAGLPQLNEVVGSYVAKTEEQIRRVSSDVAEYFLPHARTLLEKASRGELAMNDDDINTVSEDDEKEVAGVALDTESLLARILAAVSNRKSFTSRSVITGEEDRLTLQFKINPKGVKAPETISEFQRVIGNFLEKKLMYSDFRFRKAAVSFVGDEKGTGQSDRVFMQDFDADVGEEILKRMKGVEIAGLTIERCTSSPGAWNSSSHGFGGENDGYQGRDSFDRNRFGGDRYERKSFSNRGDHRSFDREGGFRRDRFPVDREQQSFSNRGFGGRRSDRW